MYISDYVHKYKLAHNGENLNASKQQTVVKVLYSKVMGQAHAIRTPVHRTEHTYEDVKASE